MKRVITAVAVGMMVAGCGTVLPPSRSQIDAMVVENRAHYAAVEARQKALSDAQWAARAEEQARAKAEQEAKSPGSTWTMWSKDARAESLTKAVGFSEFLGKPKDPRVCDYYPYLMKRIFDLRNQGVSSLEVFNTLKDSSFPHKELRLILHRSIVLAYGHREYYGKRPDKGWQMECASIHFRNYIALSSRCASDSLGQGRGLNCNGRGTGDGFQAR